jgi:hypothetical protein
MPPPDGFDKNTPTPHEEAQDPRPVLVTKRYWINKEFSIYLA